MTGEPNRRSQELDEWLSLRVLAYRLSGWPVALGLAVTIGTELSRWAIGFPAVNPHGFGMLIAAASIVGGMVWVPVGGIALALKKRKGTVSTPDFALLLINTIGVTLFCIACIFHSWSGK